MYLPVEKTENPINMIMYGKLKAGGNRCTARLELQFTHSVMSNSLRPLGPQLPCGGWMASLSITNSQSLLKHMSIKSVMPSKHLILCPLLLLWPSIFLPSTFQMSQLFASGGQSTEVSASLSVFPMNFQDCFPLGWRWKALI